jgi:outer membrane biosynthesis protein TonB
MFAFRIQAHLISTGSLTALALCLVLLAAGCQKKPAHTVPTVLVPSIETQPQPAPAQNPPDEKANVTPETAPVSTPPIDEQKAKPKPRNPKPVTRKPAQPAQPAPVITEAPKPEPARSEPAKPTTPDSSVQITADVPRAAVQSQKQNTENLLRNSEGKLGQISRNLSDSEQGMLRQARNYIAQSNQALQGGDVERAYNLAVKASLLANELAK